MKRTLYRNSAIALAVLLVGASIAQAQVSKPVVVVAIPGYDELMADVDFLGGLGGRPGASQMADGMLKMMTQGQGLKGLDKTKPFGLVVTLENGVPTPTVLVPVTSAKDLLNLLTMIGQGQVGPVQEEAGVFKVGVPNGDSVYVREKAGWAYVTQEKDAALPEDPSKSIAGLSKDYDIAARIYLQNVPPDQKKVWTEKFGQFMQMAAAMQQQAGDNPLAKLGQNNVQAQVAAIERLLNEADQITIGWKLDRQAKNTHLDFTVTAVPGSPMDQQMQKLGQAKTNFAGFLMPDAAVTASLSGTSSPQDIEQGVNTLEQLKTKMAEAIDQDNSLKDDKDRAQVKAVAAQILDTVIKTVKTGKSDGGGVLLLAPDKLQLAVGGFNADGPGLDAAVKNLIELAKGEPKFNDVVADVKLDVATHRDVKFHQINLKLPPEAEESVKKIFGDVVELYIGTGPDSAYFALGKGSLELLKSVMDKSASEPNKPVQPFQLSIALTPILKFAASVNPNDPHVAMVANQFELAQGKDHILVNAKPISGGMMYRVEVEDGIIEAIGQISRAAMQQQGGPGGFQFGPGG